jgi:hypothetical protein
MTQVSWDLGGLISRKKPKALIRTTKVKVLANQIKNTQLSIPEKSNQVPTLNNSRLNRVKMHKDSKELLDIPDRGRITSFRLR